MVRATVGIVSGVRVRAVREYTPSVHNFMWDGLGVRVRVRVKTRVGVGVGRGLDWHQSQGQGHVSGPKRVGKS